VRGAEARVSSHDIYFGARTASGLAASEGRGGGGGKKEKKGGPLTSVAHSACAEGEKRGEEKERGIQ